MIMSYMCFTVEIGIELLRPHLTKHLDDNMEETTYGKSNTGYSTLALQAHIFIMSVVLFFLFFEVIALIMLMYKNSRVSQN